MRGRTRLLLLPLLLCLAVPARLSADFDATQVDTDLGATERPDHIVLTWTDDPRTTQTVTWRSSRAASAGRVEYREEGQSEPASMTATAREFAAVSTDTPGGFNLYSVTLRNLKPGTRYLYRVFAGERPGPERSFATEGIGREPFEFLVFGDSQTGVETPPSYRAWHDTVTQAYARHPAVKFMILTGDQVDEGLTYVHWNNWFAAAGDAIGRAPFMPVIGNHDCVGALDPATQKRPSSWTPSYYLAQFPVFRNGPAGMEGQAYSFDYGEAHLAVVNSERVYDRDAAGNQVAWLDRDLASSAKPWKLVFFHRPPYYLRPARTNAAVREMLCPVLDRNRVDVVFNGHDHGFARTYPIRDGRLFSRPRDGTVYYITGRSGGYAYRDLSGKIWNAFFYDVQDQPNYLLVRVGPGAMTVDAYKQDGTLFDTYTIDKQDDARSSPAAAPARYASARFVVNGEMPTGLASENMGTARLVNGEWFVNAKVFMGAIGGGVYYGTEDVRIFRETSFMSVPKEKVFITDRRGAVLGPGDATAERKIPFVSVGIVKEFTGFDCRYDESLNVLFFSR